MMTYLENVCSKILYGGFWQMQFTQKRPTDKHRRFFASPRVLCILGFVCAYLVALTTLAPSASAAALSAPGGNVSDPVVRQVDIARPAVVRIVTMLNGQLTVHFTATVTATFPQNGGSYSLGLTGSGAFISPHGEILTADHVVNPPHGQQLDQDLYYYAAQDVADYINTHFQVTAPYSANDAYNLLVSGGLQSSTSYGQPSSQVYLSTSYAGTISATKLETVPASDHAAVDKIEAESNFDANDVAIIHVSGMDNMPSIQLGDSSKVAEQDNLTIIGYPGLADLSESPTDYLTSSINKVYVSALKTTDGGAPVIQVGGNVEHGDSGGPALDENGNIVGIVSFGYSGTNGDYGQTSFLQASNSALTLIKAQGINTTPGTFENAWAQAMNDYASTSAGHWQKAAQELQSLSHSYPSFQGITAYLTYARNQATHEPGASGTGVSGSSAWLIVLLVVLVLVVLGIAFYFIFRRSARPVVVAPGGTQYPFGTYQQTGSYQQSSGIYSPTAYGASLPYAQPSSVAAMPGMQPPLPSGESYQPYTSPATYGALPGLLPQTPRPLSGATPLPQAPAEPQAAFSLPHLQTPRPLEGDAAAPSAPTWEASIPASFAASNEQGAPEPVAVPNGQSMSEPAAPSAGNGALSEVLEKNATYTLPREQAEMLSARTLSEAPEQTPWPSGNGWSVPAMAKEATTSEEERTMLAPAQARTFSVPRRPSSEVALSEAPQINTPGAPLLLAPCGHANTPGVRFCRICGQPVDSAAPEASPDVS